MDEFDGLLATARTACARGDWFAYADDAGFANVECKGIESDPFNAYFIARK